MQVHHQLNGGHYTGSSYCITMPIFHFMWCFNTQTTIIKSNSTPNKDYWFIKHIQTATQGILEVHMSFCLCILFFFWIFPSSLTCTFNWFGPNIICFHNCGNQSCCRSLYYQLFFTELETRVSHVEAVSSAFLSLCDLVSVLKHFDKLSWNLTSQAVPNSCQEIFPSI